MIYHARIISKPVILLTLALGTFHLSGCSAAKEQLGLTRHAPDEFSVLERAPLAIPSDLTKLPPPIPGAPRPQDTPVAIQAKTAVLGEESLQTGIPTAPSTAEAKLLAKTGATAAPSDIRSKINSEAEAETEDKRAVVKRILGLGSGEKPSTVVDAQKEAERIQADKKKGSAITGATTPTVEK